MKIIKINTEQSFNQAIPKRRPKILFIVLTYLRDEGNAGNIQDYPYGVLSIIKHNEKIADFKVLDLIVNPSNESYLNKVVHIISEFKPDIVGLSIMFDNAYFSLAPVSEACKKCIDNILVVAGGPAISPVAHKVLANQPNLDAICFSEGEVPIEHLIKSDNYVELLKKHPSWVTRNIDTKVDNSPPSKSLLEDLSTVVDIDYSYLEKFPYKVKTSYNPIDSRYINNLRAFTIITSRGCPFKCTFCWHSGEDDRSMRYANVDALILHIDRLVNQYQANSIFIYDDMLLLNLNRAKEIFRKLARYNLRIELPNGLSPTYFDAELVELMYLAGVRSVRLAIESGDEWVVRNLVNKPMKISHVQIAIDLLRKYKIWVIGFFVVGLPGETDDHRKTTLEKIYEWGIDNCAVSVASPIKGSLLYEECLREGYIDPNAEFLVSGYLFGENVINTELYSANYISEQAYLINLDVNFVNSNRINKGDFEIAQDYFSHVSKTYEAHGFAYYFQAYCAQKLGLRDKAQEFFDKAMIIRSESKDWGRYFNLFQLPVNFTDFEDYCEKRKKRHKSKIFFSDKIVAE